MNATILGLIAGPIAVFFFGLPGLLLIWVAYYLYVKSKNERGAL